MPSPITHDNVRQLLMKCIVRNADGVVGVRFTEHVSYELWANLIRTNHGIQVCSATPCIWVPEIEYEQRRRLYEGAAIVDPVTRVVVTQYDPESSITQRKTRYIFTEDWLGSSAQVPEQQPQARDSLQSSLEAPSLLAELVLAHLYSPDLECLHTTHAGIAIATSRLAATSHAA